MNKIKPFKSPDTAKKVAKRYAADLAKKATDAEIYFSKYLLTHKISFEFQKVIHFNDRFFIVDFYIPCKRKFLAIELDGYYHFTKERSQKDHYRTKRLWQKNIQVVRYTNGDV